MLTATNGISKQFLAGKVIENARNQVYFALRYLESALFCLQPVEKEDTTTGSDGKYYYYNADYLCRRFLQNPADVEYDYLHTVLHCLFRHPMRLRHPESMQRELPCESRQLDLIRNERINESIYWNLAADIVVTEVIAEMNLPQFQQVIPQQCFEILEQIRGEVHFMDLPQIVQYLREHETQLARIYGIGLREMAELFARDIHSFWGGESQKADFNQKAAGDSGIRMQSVLLEEHAGKSEDAEIRSVEFEEKEQENLVELWMQKEWDWQNLEESWKEIAETIAQHRDIHPPSAMMRMLRRMTRDSYDYTEFLRKFARPEECMKLDEDSFDYVYYVYGLNGMGWQRETVTCHNKKYHDVRNKVCGRNNCDESNDFDVTIYNYRNSCKNKVNRTLPSRKIALIEPLEYREEYRIRDFVIAIDTSASCSGRLVQQFLNKTYHILKNTESFSERVVVHILQCDCAIREDIRIESLRQLEDYISQIQIRGMGGTDFRPVFTHVDGLCAERKLRNPGGLIYFTDGRGIYPKKPPAYRTAFVFVGHEDEESIPPVPSWAMKLYLEDV